MPGISRLGFLFVLWTFVSSYVIMSPSKVPGIVVSVVSFISHMFVTHDAWLGPIAAVFAHTSLYAMIQVIMYIPLQVILDIYANIE